MDKAGLIEDIDVSVDLVSSSSCGVRSEKRKTIQQLMIFLVSLSSETYGCEMKKLSQPSRADTREIYSDYKRNA